MGWDIQDPNVWNIFYYDTKAIERRAAKVGTVTHQGQTINKHGPLAGEQGPPSPNLFTSILFVLQQFCDYFQVNWPQPGVTHPLIFWWVVIGFETDESLSQVWRFPVGELLGQWDEKLLPVVLWVWHRCMSLMPFHCQVIVMRSRQVNWHT